MNAIEIKLECAKLLKKEHGDVKILIKEAKMLSDFIFGASSEPESRKPSVNTRHKD